MFICTALWFSARWYCQKGWSDLQGGAKNDAGVMWKVEIEPLYPGCQTSFCNWPFDYLWDHFEHLLSNLPKSKHTVTQTNLHILRRHPVCQLRLLTGVRGAEARQRFSSPLRRRQERGGEGVESLRSLPGSSEGGLVCGPTTLLERRVKKNWHTSVADSPHLGIVFRINVHENSRWEC